MIYQPKKPAIEMATMEDMARRVKREVDPAVGNCYREYLEAKEYHARAKAREAENWRFFWGLDAELGMGQWPDKAVKYMTERNRSIPTHNFLMPIVDEITAGFLEAPIDPALYPVSGAPTSLIDGMMGAYKTDKEVCNWGHAKFELYRAALIHEGVVKMSVTDKYDDAGNIQLTYCLPGSTTWDPRWRTLPCSDCKRLWYEEWMTVADIIAMYPEMYEELKWNVEQDGGGQNYGANVGISPRQSLEDIWGSEHRVVQEYRMVEKKVDCDYAITENGRVEIPNSILREQKIAWLNRFHPSWVPDRVFSEEKTEKTCMVRTIAPSLCIETPLQDAPSGIQAGCLPFWKLSAARANGESHSIIDSGKDAQMAINYLESMIQYKIQVEGGGGAQFADRQMFVSSEEYERYIQERNDPTAVFETRPGLLQSGQTPTRPVSTSGVPAEVYKLVEHLMLVVLPRVCRSPQARQGTSDPGESGRLFQLKTLQADRAVYAMHVGASLMFNELFEAYFLAGADLYSRECLERTFAWHGGAESVTLNERVEVTTEDGVTIKGIRNNVAELKKLRLKVIIDEQAASPTQKIENLNTTSKLLQSLGTFGPATAQNMMRKLIEYMPGLNDEDREEMLLISDKELELKVEEIAAKTAETRLNRLKIEAELKKTIEAMEQEELSKSQAVQGMTPEQQGIMPGMPQQGVPMGGPPPPPAPPTDGPPMPSPEEIMAVQQGQGQPAPQAAPSPRLPKIRNIPIPKIGPRPLEARVERLPEYLRRGQP